MKLKINWDGLGIATSLACAIHCAVLPIFLSSLPIFGINLIHHPGFEWLMICLAIAIGAYSLFHGYHKHHKSATPILVFFAGSCFLLVKQFYVPFEIPLLVLAVLLIVTAHYINYLWCRRSQCVSALHSH